MVKVTVLGCSGGIGQPLSLLLKLNNKIDELSLYDIVGSPGIKADLSHIPTKCKVSNFQPDSKNEGISNSLKNSDIVLIPAGIPRKPGMTRDDLFAKNAGIVRDLINQIAINSPNAFICIISNPVNSMVPIAKEVLTKHGVFNPKKLIGITTLDILRLETFLSDLIQIDINYLKGKVITIGGHSGDTIVPILHIDKKISNKIENLLNQEQIDSLIHRVQYGGDEVVKAKNGTGSATLSMAYAAYRFTESLLDVLSSNNDSSIVNEVGYVYVKGLKNGDKLIKNKLNSNTEFFSLPIKISKNGIEFIEWPKISYKLEEKLCDLSISKLSGDIAKGTNFVKGTKL